MESKRSSPDAADSTYWWGAPQIPDQPTLTIDKDSRITAPSGAADLNLAQVKISWVAPDNNGAPNNAQTNTGADLTGYAVMIKDHAGVQRAAPADCAPATGADAAVAGAHSCTVKLSTLLASGGTFDLAKSGAQLSKITVAVAAKNARSPSPTYDFGNAGHQYSDWSAQLAPTGPGTATDNIPYGTTITACAASGACTAAETALRGYAAAGFT